MELAYRIIIYALILIGLYIFVKMSKIEINGIKIIKLRYSVLIALFFPMVLIIFFIIGSILIGIILMVIFIIFLIYIWRRMSKRYIK